MTKKTPIADKIHRAMKLLEKIQSDVPLANTMDTGIDTDHRTQVWRDTKKKYDTALGLDNIRNTFGQPDANKIDVPMQYGPKEKDTNKAVSNALFSAPDIQKKKVDLLQVKEQATTPETKTEMVNPYIWRTPDTLQPLTEVIGVSGKQGNKEDFYRIAGTDSIFTRRMGEQFANCYYAGISQKLTPAVSVFLYSLNGTRPRGGVNAVRFVNQYALQQYKQPLMEAVDTVIAGIKNPDDIALLEQLKGLHIDDLPTAIYNSLLVGILDAANVGIHKDNEELTVDANKVGHQALEPQAALRNLQNALFITARPGDSLELPGGLLNSISTGLESVKTAASAYDPLFIAALKEARKKNKWNIKKTTQSAKTTMSFILAQIINQINNNKYNIDLSSTPEVSSEVYLSKFGFTADRITEFAKVFKSSRVTKNCPIVVMRGKVGGDSDNLVYSVDTTISDIDNNFDFKLSNIKPLGLTAMVHKYLMHEALSRLKVLNKQTYLEVFHDLFDNTENIQSARNGPLYLERMLNTALNDDLSFNEGVFFVGLSPMFWDAPNGNQIKVATKDPAIALRNIIWPYKITGSGEESKVWGYKIEKAEELFFEREIDEAAEKINPAMPDYRERLAEMQMSNIINDAVPSVIEERQKQLLGVGQLQFKTLAELRNGILKMLYNLDTSENENINQVEELIKILYKNISSGFWTTDGDEFGGNLACYNPWKKGRTLYTRFTKDNVSRILADASRETAGNALRASAGRATLSPNNFIPLKKP